MIKNLRPIGNSVGLIIDRPIMELLGMTRDTQVELKVTSDGKGLEIRPIAPGDHRTRVRESADRMMDVHSDTLKRLAE